MKTIWMFSKKLKVEFLNNPATPLLHTYPKEMKSVSPRGVCTPILK
jgi:hypothetical protein